MCQPLLTISKLIDKMLKRNINKEKIDFVRSCGIDLDKWLCGFGSVESSITKTVDIIKNHPLVPADICVHGFVIDPETGELTTIDTLST